MLFDIATGNHARETSWKREKVSWQDFVRRCHNVFRTPETFHTFINSSKETKAAIKDGPAFMSGTLAGTNRLKGEVIDKQIVTLDADYAYEGFIERVRQSPFALVYYTTHSHNPLNPRYRICIPLDEPATPAEYEAIARRIAEYFGIEAMDTTCYDLNRLMYWPSASIDAVFDSFHTEQPIPSKKGILNTYTNFLDIASWPLSEKEKLRRVSGLMELGDPRLKSGIIGAFCNVYSITEAIGEFLHDRYLASDNPDRYTYYQSQTVNGLVVYDDLHAHSHHGSDPLSQMTANAFDLVRVHLFGTGPDSTKEMMEFCRNIPKVRSLIVSEKVAAAAEFSDLSGGAVANGMPRENPGIGGKAWYGGLELDKQNKVLSTANNFSLILNNDPQMAGCFAFDSFANRLVMKKLPGWRKEGDSMGFRDTDDAHMRVYMETRYGVSGKEKIIDALAVAADLAAYHPVREYLSNLQWDGMSRIPWLFHAFMGAEDTEYLREISTKWFTGAVARIFKPGIKFDNMIVFVGPEGIGKSTLIDKLAGDWFSDTSLDLRNKKDSMEDLQGIWIMEWGELSALKTASVESVKSFVAKRKDRFRVAYGRRVEEFARQCIFMGTSNTLAFLSSPDGNRRFWPVLTRVGPILMDVHTDLTSDMRDQIWAEAVQLFKSGAPLHLSERVIAMAVEVQEAHTEVDPRVIDIEEFLNRWLPPNWKDMDIITRKQYHANYDESKLKADYVQRQKVCVKEIWFEMFNGESQNMQTRNVRFIADYLRKQKLWAPFKSTAKFEVYGEQRGFYRIVASVN